MATHTSDLFVGARLGAARSQAGIPLEKAAKDTRIRVQRLREIESDDFSGFAHPIYVRLFLLDYAGYLGVPVEEIRPMLPDIGGVAAGGFRYLDALSENFTPSVSPRLKSRLKKTFVTTILLASLLVVGFFFWSTLRKIERVSHSSAPSSTPDLNQKNTEEQPVVPETPTKTAPPEELETKSTSTSEASKPSEISESSWQASPEPFTLPALVEPIEIPPAP